MLLIVGGGFAALETAIQISTIRPTCDVTLISAGRTLAYKPWLIYVPAGRRRFAEVGIPLTPMASRFGFQLIEDRDNGVVLDARQFSLSKGRLSDYLHILLATVADVYTKHLS